MRMEGMWFINFHIDQKSSFFYPIQSSISRSIENPLFIRFSHFVEKKSGNYTLDDDNFKNLISQSIVGVCIEQLVDPPPPPLMNKATHSQSIFISTCTFIKTTTTAHCNCRLVSRNNAVRYRKTT